MGARKQLVPGRFWALEGPIKEQAIHYRYFICYNYYDYREKVLQKWLKRLRRLICKDELGRFIQGKYGIKMKTETILESKSLQDQSLL